MAAAAPAADSSSPEPAADSKKPAPASEAPAPQTAGSIGPQPTAAADGGSSRPPEAADSPASEPAAVMQADAGASAAPVAPDPPIERGPYFVSGSWHGYFWLARHGAGTTVTATNFDTEQFAAPICIRGLVAATSDNTGNAILGVNVNQSSGADMTVQTLAPALDGIRVAIDNNSRSTVRVQVQALDGATNERARWCAEISGSGGFIPWSAFNTACWDSSGTAYAREPISGAMLLVPGAPNVQTAFDICLVSLAEASAAVSSSAAGSGS